MASKLYVGSLPYSIISESPRERFAQCGTVESAAEITDRLTGQSGGFGFVEMSTDTEARVAIQNLNDQTFARRSKVVGSPSRSPIRQVVAEALDRAASACGGGSRRPPRC